MMVPTRRSAVLLAAGLPLSLAPAVIDARLWPLWAVAAALSVLAIALDAVLAVPPSALAVEVDAPAEIAVGAVAEARFAITLSSTRRALDLEVLCDLDADLEPVPVQRVEVHGGGRAELTVPLRPRRRGTVAIDRLWLRWAGPLGLVCATRVRTLDRTIAVVPDIAAARAVAMRFAVGRSSTAGLRTERYVGDGTEFESLQAWVPGLDPRSVDWKASARHRTLLSRRFRAERNHQLVLAIDGGHLMGEPLAGLPRIDHAIHRALALAWLGLRTGDRVGLYAFDARPRLFVAPRGGLGAFPQLRRRSAELGYGSAETNHALGALELTRLLRRRSLIVVFTEFADSVTAELMLDHLDRLARRHVIVFVALRDPAIDLVELRAPERLAELHTAVIAADLRRERETVLERLRRSGVHVVDALPREATPRLLDRYLEIKRRELV